jgi:hypothetical protein
LAPGPKGASSHLGSTGTEDFLKGAWYFGAEHHDTAFAALIELSTNHAAQSGAISAVRWHILHDAIPFEQTFQLSFEIGAKRSMSSRRKAQLSASNIPSSSRGRP